MADVIVVRTEQGKVGPELASMGPLHELEYFTEAIVKPNAVIDVDHREATV